MQRNPDLEEILYDFTIYFDSLYSQSLDLEGKVILVWNKGTMKRIVSEEKCTTRSKHTLIAQSIKLQQSLYFSKKTSAYRDGSKVQISCYVNDADYSQPVFIGIINVNLSRIINERRDRKGKVQNQEIDLDLERCDYQNTAVKLIISAKKNFKFSQKEQINEIKGREENDSQNQRFQILDDDMIDNLPEKYEDEEEDEFFRGYAHAQEYNQSRGTFQSENDTQSIRNKIIFEDVTPEIREPHGTNEFNQSKQKYFEGVHTPPKGDQDTVHITHTRDIHKTKRFEKQDRQEYDSINMLDFDQIEETKNDNERKNNSNQPDVHNLLKMYEKQLSDFVVKKDFDNSRDIERESSVRSSDKKRPYEMYQRIKGELEALKEKYASLSAKNDQLKYELKTEKNSHNRSVMKFEAEINDLRDHNQQLTEEVSSLINYKSRFEQMKAENQKLMEIEERYEDQVEQLQEKLEELGYGRTSSMSNSEQLQQFSEKIVILENKLDQKEQELKEERLDNDIRNKKELRIIEEGYTRKYNKLKKQKEDLEDELYELQKRCEAQVDIINQNEYRQRKEKENKPKEEKDAIDIEFYAKKYLKDCEERGSHEVKTESGSQAVSMDGKILDITDLDMKVIENQHKLERLEFYENNNIELLHTLEEKDSEYDQKVQFYEEGLESLKMKHKEEITKLEDNLKKEINAMNAQNKLKIEHIQATERSNADADRKELRDEFQKMFKERFSEWKTKSVEYENKIRHLENIINSN
ncbi:unnamed protein product [Moneuplotes crassus]|uniref:C2 NT-type domain-containing protein n=1 Tax=Euplotes crassus TaxID=5936 RepID=A0AAD1Y812_EUPCR|nr:unnamed protein product [Moneuplotes crassus]